MRMSLECMILCTNKLCDLVLIFVIYDQYSPESSSYFAVECSEDSSGDLVATESTLVLKNGREQVLLTSFDVRNWSWEWFLLSVSRDKHVRAYRLLLTQQ